MLAVYTSQIMFTINAHFPAMPALSRAAARPCRPLTLLLLCSGTGVLACSGSETSERPENLGLDSAAFEAKFAQPTVALPLPDSVRFTASGDPVRVPVPGRAPAPAVADTEAARRTGSDAAGASAVGVAGAGAGAGAGAASRKAAKVDLANVKSPRSDSIARAMVARMTSSAGTTQSRSDTVRGIVTLAGTAPAVSVGLRPVAGGAPVQLSGMATSSLARLGGATVTVRGMRITARDFVVAEFFVRAVNGVAVIDGVLESAAGGWSLRPTDGSPRTRLAGLPDALRGREGSRVWIAVETAPNAPRAAGVIGRR
jgi:hypothetical protein